MGIERPLGVSGILRCRNCADYLDACIDSCIDALDELVAVYHDCDDDTPETLKFKQKQYPDKIKVYEYLPYILPIVPDKPMLQFAKNLPNNSQHLLSGYCNYALSKASYRYAVKIDADQIYFSQILKRFCDAYRSTEKVKFNALEYIASGLHHAYIECFSHEKIHKFYLLEKISLLSFRYYRSYIEKRIIRDKIAVSLSGINLYRYDGQWKIGLGDKRVPEMYPPFNGVRDTFFFEVTAHTCFEKIINTTSDVNNQRISEIMYYHKEILDGGFCWFHVKPIMTAEKDKNKKIQMEYPDRFVALYELKKNPYRIFYKRYHPFIAVRFAEPAYSYFYTAMRKFIPWKLLGGIEQMYNSNMKNKNRIVMINPRDYYLEFHEELDKRLLKFTSDLEEEDVTRMLLGKHYIKEPLITFLFYQLTHEKERYNRCRLDGKPIDESMGRVDAFLAMFGEGVPEKKEEPTTDICQHPWYKALSEYKNHIIIYLFNARQLQYLTPLINELDSPILLLSEYELPDETDLPDTVTALTIEFSSFRIFSNPYVEHCFPLIYHYTSFFSIMLRILQPTGIICLEGCHIEEQLLATVAQDYEIPSICIQQGWPSMMRTGFRRLPYRYFFTWGERFSKLWEKYNPQPQFTPMGYMYDVAHVEKENKKCVTFFLQSPCYLSDTSYFKDMLELITDSAGLYPEISFMVREHPDYKIDSTLIDNWKVYPNLHIATDWELKEVYRHTLVTVSHFSSALMEGVAHGCIPLVYDVTTNSRYYPDVEKEGLGKIAKTKDEFPQQLKEILSYSYDENPYLQNIRERQKQWFAATGNATLNQMAETIKKITHRKNITLNDKLMKIAMLSSLNPTDIHSWSGTLFHIYKALTKSNDVVWIGKKELMEVSRFHFANMPETGFVPEKYAVLFGKMLSDRLKYEYYDLIVCRDSFLYAYLITDIPLVFIGDTTFHLFNDYLRIKDEELVALLENIERKALQKASLLFLSSEWAKRSAIKDYQVDPKKIKVVEFGANIEPATVFKRALPSAKTCNLLFIGTNWVMKGGDKAIDTYRILKDKGINCTLTVIGSKPTDGINDDNIKVYPFIDKATEEGQSLFRQLFTQSHFLIVPTLFDCYGIVFCEAAAYGIPSLASDVGGVGQIIKDRKNGFLLPINAGASEYADRILETINDGSYHALSLKCCKDYIKRLNWHAWDKKVEKALEALVAERNEFYVPVYVINMKEREERRNHILAEFEGRPEFDVTLVEACTHEKGGVGLWNSIVKMIRLAQENNDEVIIMCEDDHFFTEHYSPGLLMKEIQEAYLQGADMLSGGIGGFGQAIHVGCNRYWVDWLWCTQFVVIYKHFFDTILAYKFKETDTADGVFSQLSANKMVIYPFISEQKDFGYSDVTLTNMQNKGRIREHFAWANKKFSMIRAVEEL